MVVRKARRDRTALIRSIEDFGRIDFDLYLQKESIEDHLAEMFPDEIAMREFYVDNRKIFSEMRCAASCRDRWQVYYHAPGERHPLWWLCESPKPRDESVTQYEQLKAMGELPPEEIEVLQTQAMTDNKQLQEEPWHRSLPFRRDWRFWEFVAREPRDPSIFESEQLSQLGELTFLEKEIIENPLGALGLKGPHVTRRTRFYYLPVAERKTLGLAKGHNPAIEAMLE